MTRSEIIKALDEITVIVNNIQLALLTGPVTSDMVDPLNAPEIEGADKDGDGGYAVRIELDED